MAKEFLPGIDKGLRILNLMEVFSKERVTNQETAL